MSNDKSFTASNGVVLDEYGFRVSPGNKETATHEARIEFYRHLEDERLGRWRDPRHPDIYVRPGEGEEDWVGVVKDNEEGLAYGQFRRGVRATLDPMSIVASAYFDAHPEPKPEWYEAKEGEVWLITTAEMYRDAPAIVQGDLFYMTNAYDSDQPDCIERGGVRDARRIYPE